MSNPPGTRAVKAILSPKGDQEGASQYDTSYVRRRASPPCASMMKICGAPERSEVKAICWPSGDQEGEVSMASLVVRRCSWPSPARRV